MDILDTIYKGTLAKYKDKDFGDIRESEGYILIYSIDEIKTYEIAKAIYQEIINIKKFLKADIIGESSIIFVGNKNDLKVENDFSKEVKEFCSDNKIKHIQTNTLDGNNVKEVFESVVKEILYNRQNRKNDVEEKLEEPEEEEEDDDDEEEGNIEKGGSEKSETTKKEKPEQALNSGKPPEESQGKKEENNENKEKEIKEEDSTEKEKNEEKSNKIEKKEEEAEKNEIKEDCNCCLLF